MKNQKTMKLSIITIAGATALVSTTAIAQSALQFSDVDGDGVISAEEITTVREEARAAALAQFDVDGNGELSRDERRALRDSLFDAHLFQFDVDGDGELSREERRAAKDARHDAVQVMLDVNGDGVVSDAEGAGFAEVASERGGRKGDKHGKRVKRGEGKGKRGDRDQAGNDEAAIDQDGV